VAVKIVALLICIFLILFGVVFLVAAGEGRTFTRLVVGGAMVAAGAFLMVFLRKASTSSLQARLDQKIEISGDVNLQNISCSKCGGALSSESISVKAGAVFVSCPYCKAEYQLEEKPRW
jgi:hypothetical protein